MKFLLFFIFTIITTAVATQSMDTDLEQKLKAVDADINKSIKRVKENIASAKSSIAYWILESQGESSREFYNKEIKKEEKKLKVQMEVLEKLKKMKAKQEGRQAMK